MTGMSSQPSSSQMSLSIVAAAEASVPAAACGFDAEVRSERDSKNRLRLTAPAPTRLADVPGATQGSSQMSLSIVAAAEASVPAAACGRHTHESTRWSLPTIRSADLDTPVSLFDAEVRSERDSKNRLRLTAPAPSRRPFLATPKSRRRRRRRRPVHSLRRAGRSRSRFASNSTTTRKRMRSRCGHSTSSTRRRR
jgi:hypothetical protein